MSVPADGARENAEGRSTEGADPELPNEQRLFQIVEAYLRELEQGRRPDRNEWLARYPDLAPALGRCLDGLGFMQDAAGSISQARQSAQTTGTGPLANGVIGDFQIVKEIGRGGMGIIYEAVQLSLGRRVALKVLPFAAGLDDRHLQRFRQESQAAAQLHHTNIVPVFAIGCERGVHFYAMQLIDGLSLDRIVDQLQRDSADVPTGMEAAKDRSRNEWRKLPACGADIYRKLEAYATEGAVPDMPAEEPGDGSPATPRPRVSASAPAIKPTTEPTLAELSGDLSTQRTRHKADVYRAVARLMAQAAEALDYAHRQGIIHRDIKPANLMVDKQRNLWITDFGLAHLHGEEGLTRTGELLGTIRYASPEQLSGQRFLLDQRTDLYSLGATFYELVTLRPVFAGDTRPALLHQVLNHEPIRPRAVDRHLPLELETILLKLLSKSPAERYPSARELAEDLQRFLRDEPIAARPPGLIERARKWGRRHPAHVGAAVVIMFFVLVMSAISNWLIAQANSRVRAALDRERLRAEEAEARFSQARQAVDLLIELSEHDLADKPPLQPLQKQVLEAALVFYQEFIAQHRGNPAREAELLAVEQRLRKVLEELLLLEGAGQLLMLAEQDVQADLALAAADAERISVIAKQFSEKSLELVQGYRHLTPDERRSRFVELARTNERLVDSIVNERQRQRLEQIRIQLLGFHALNEPKIVKALRLTDSQRQSLRGIDMDTFIRMDESMTPTDDVTRPERRRTLARSALERSLELLTPEQLAQWKELTGRPFQGRLAKRLPGMPPGP